MMDFMRWIRGAALGCTVVAAISPGNGVAADIGKGREIYTGFCAGCHGDTGRGVMPGIPDFTFGATLMRPDAVLAESIRSGVNAMPGFRGIITDFQILDVVAYLRTMQ